jgi:AraC-like DNA-binding protein
MMKLLLLLGLLGGLRSPGKAQSIADLLVQLELDREKLSSMKSTLNEMYQGYTELKDGLTHIRDIAKANFNLHADFLHALLAVSSAVSGDPRITTILDAEYQIVAGYRSAGARWSGSGIFSEQELAYILGTYSVLLQRCLQSVEELTMVLTADELRMSDAERMAAIGRIQADTQGQLTMMQGLDNTLSIQVAQRQRAARDINSLKSLYDLPN